MILRFVLSDHPGYESKINYINLKFRHPPIPEVGISLQRIYFLDLSSHSALLNTSKNILLVSGSLVRDFSLNEHQRHLSWSSAQTMKDPGKDHEKHSEQGRRRSGKKFFNILKFKFYLISLTLLTIVSLFVIFTHENKKALLRNIKNVLCEHSELL